MSIIIPSCPKDRAEIKQVIHEISNSMARTEAENEYRKEAFKELAERFEVDAKMLKRMARDYHKDLYKKSMDEVSDYSLLYENIMQTGKDVDEDEESDLD